MTRSPHRPPQLVGRVFRGSAAIRHRLLTRHQLQGAAWRRLHRDVYVDARVLVTHELRCQAAGLILPPGAAITGRSAACLRGVPLGEPDDPVSVIIPSDRHPQVNGLRIRRCRLSESEVLPGEPPVTTPQRAAWEIACEPDGVEAVVALDVLLQWNYIRLEDMSAWTAAHPHSRGAKALALADSGAGSPQETRARLRVLSAGFSPPVTQFKIFHGAEFLAKVDLAWPDAKVAVEYDGIWHAGAQQLPRDRARLNKLVAQGWTVLHLTARDLKDPACWARFAAQLQAALSGPSKNW